MISSLVYLLVFGFYYTVEAHSDIISSVDCFADRMVVHLSLTSDFANATLNQIKLGGPGVAIWPASAPRKDGSQYYPNANCSQYIAIKPSTPTDAIVHLYYKECNASVTALIGKDGYAEDYYVSQEWAGFPYSLVTPKPNEVVPNGPVFKFSSYCIYPANVYLNGTNGGGVTVVNPHHGGGGGGGTVIPAVKAGIFNSKGGLATNASIGTDLFFDIELETNSKYDSILPIWCRFANDPDPNYQYQAKIPFIEGGCPLFPLPAIVSRPEKINGSFYRTNFTAFNFGNSPYLYIHCRLQLCPASTSSCNETCWYGTHMSRGKRSVMMGDTLYLDEDDVSGAQSVPLTVDLQIYGGANTQPATVAPTIPRKWIIGLYILGALIGILLGLFCCCFFGFLFFSRRRKERPEAVAPEMPPITQFQAFSGKVYPIPRVSQNSGEFLWSTRHLQERS